MRGARKLSIFHNEYKPYSLIKAMKILQNNKKYEGYSAVAIHPEDPNTKFYLLSPNAVNQKIQEEKQRNNTRKLAEKAFKERINGEGKYQYTFKEGAQRGSNPYFIQKNDPLENEIE